MPIEKQSLCWATTGSICVVGTSVRWDVDAIEQWQIWIAILAASIKSPSEAVKTLLAGANHLTLPFDVLQAMTVHELSQSTVDEFANNGRGISYYWGGNNPSETQTE